MDSQAVSHKKALLRLLAQRETERLGIPVNEDELLLARRNFCWQHLLLSEEALTEWLARAELNAASFQRLLHEYAAVAKLEELFGDEIQSRSDEQARIEEMRRTGLSDFPPAEASFAGDGWLQVNVALSRNGDDDAIPAAIALFDRLRAELPKWREAGLVQAFYFVRKPPDGRLRFFCPGHEEELATELAGMLGALQQDGFVQLFFRTIYEPEEARFGGVAAMQLVHDYFDADSSAWLLLQKIGAARQRSVPAGVLLTTVFNDLFRQTVTDPAEVWDIWSRLGGLRDKAESDALNSSEAIDVLSLSELRKLLSREENRILDVYDTANWKLSEGLQQLWSEGKLLQGMREILATVAMFGFNRHGLNEAAQCGLLKGMRHLWTAKAALA